MSVKGQQAEALRFLDEWLESDDKTACLQGYAGTGKTWLMGHWLETVLERKPDLAITVMAPTNKALDVLRSKCQGLDVKFATIDQFLGNRIKKNNDGETIKSRGKAQEDPDLIVCDEASMIKKEYDEDLRRRKIRTLYVGDPAQLPPINEELSTTFNVPRKFVMTEVVRYDGAIIKVATMLRERIQTGQMFLLGDMKELRGEDRSLSFINMFDLHAWALKAVEKGLDARIVAFTNADVTEHNAVMHNALYPGTPLFGVGERVIVNETFEVPNTLKDTSKPGSEDGEMLYNGEMMIVTSCERAEDVAGVVIYNVGCVREKAASSDKESATEFNLQVAFDEQQMLRVHKDLTNQIHDLRRLGNDKEVRTVFRLRAPLNKLAPLRHSYSCTVHKSQGSTYDIAFCDWSSIYRSKDRARMMYVAVTRPSKYLVLAAK